MIWILILVGVVFLIVYPGFLRKQCDCSPMFLGRIAAAVLDCGIWVSIFDAEGFSLLLLLFIAIAVGIVLLLFALNFQTVQDPLQAVLMTLWQMLGGFLIFVWLCAIFCNKKKKKDDD